MGDIDRVSKLDGGRFLTDLDHTRVARKDKDKPPQQQEEQKKEEHKDLVELHVEPDEQPETDENSAKKPKKLPPLTQQNHLDISV